MKMEITTTGNVITIKGNIKSVSDYQKIKEHIEGIRERERSIVLEIKDSISITSSIIGYLTKLVQKDGVDLSIKVGDASLMELFDDLNLIGLFKVRKV